MLILGAGTIGLSMLAALRALGSQAHILVAARYPFQAEAAIRLGASEVLRGDLYAEIARRTGGAVLKPMIGKQVVTGGWTASSSAQAAIRRWTTPCVLTRPGGTVVLVGVPGIAKNVDWTSIFLKELTVAASYTYHRSEQFQGRTWSTFELALDLMASGKVDLGWMVTHRFKLDEYDRAFKLLGQKGNSGIIKAVFEFN